MTALASTDVSVSVNVRHRDIARRGMNKVECIADITFGDGALTYPTNGIPMPAIGNFGMTRQLDAVLIEQPPGDGYVYKFDRTNHKLLMFGTGSAQYAALDEIQNTTAPAATTIRMVLIGE